MTDTDEKREYLHIPLLSLRQQVFKILEKHHDLKPKELCKIMDLDYASRGGTVKEYRKQWKREYKNRQALKCLSFHGATGWIYALKSIDRKAALESKVWQQTRARNRYLLCKVEGLGRLEWFETGRINIRIRKPATWGRVKQLLAYGFTWTNLIKDIDVFDLWANSARKKGSHLVYDTGERLPYAKIDLLREDLGVVVKTGDMSHPTSIEIEFHYPDWAERNEVLMQQISKALDLNSQQIQLFSEFMKELTKPKVSKEGKHEYIS